MDIPYMEYRLSELKQRLYNLTETVEREDYEVKGLDVSWHTEVRTRGSKEEIARVESEIEKLEKEIKEAKKYEVERAKEQKAREAREKNDAEERKKKESAEAKEKARHDKAMAKIDKKEQKRRFKRVKEMYKRGPFAYRVLDKVIPFRGPKWRVIKSYTKEELEFLVMIAKGATLYQKKQEKNLARCNMEYDKKERMWSNWHAFMNALESRYKLKNKIDIDERIKSNPYGIH